MRKALLIGLLLLAGCARYTNPNPGMEPGAKALIGAIRVEGEGFTDQPNFLELDIAPAGGAIQTYTIRAGIQKSPLPNSIPFFLPLQPGTYSFKTIRFGYGGVAVYHLNLGLTGAPVVVNANANATSLGQLVVNVNSVNQKTYQAAMALRIEPAPAVHEMFLTAHPGQTVQPYPLPLPTQ